MRSRNGWKVIWRVVAPCAGSYDHDMVFGDGLTEAAARRMFDGLRKGGHAVRLERVECGPLPNKAAGTIEKVRSLSPQNPGTKMRAIPGAWFEQQEVRS